MTLKYPHDRHNGFVQLADASGNMFVPDFTRSYSRGGDIGNAMAYCGAFLILANRINTDSNVDQPGDGK